MSILDPEPTLLEMLANREARHEEQANQHDAQAILYRTRATDCARVTAVMAKLTAEEKDAFYRILKGEI